MFDLETKPKAFHYEVGKGELIIGEHDLTFMAVFKPPEKDTVFDDYAVALRTLDQRFSDDPECRPFREFYDMATQVFIGWVNPEDREDLWITSGGKPVESTAENVRKFLQISGMSMGICKVFLAAYPKASMGNSERSPESGSGGLASEATTQTP